MKSYKRYATAHPVYARLDGTGRWLEHTPHPHVSASASFRAILRNGRSDHQTLTYELGQVDQYYSAIRRGIGDCALVNLYSCQKQAQRDYEHAIERCEHDSRWERV